MERTHFWITKGFDRNIGGYVYKVSLLKENADQIRLEWATLDPDMSNISVFPVDPQFVYQGIYGYVFDSKNYNAYLLCSD